MAPVSLFLLASCGSYHYSGYENDGVYGDSSRNYEDQTQIESQESNRSYYKNLFEEEAALYGDVLAEGAVFTDVENYSSSDGDYEGDMESNYQGGNATWGSNPDSYTINIYNDGYFGGFYNPYWGGGLYAYDPFWGPGYYGPGNWGYPYGYGYRGYYGYGYGYGFAIHPFIYGASGWYNPYNFYGNRYNNYYNNNNVAYNVGRRNATTSYRSNRTSDLRNATSLNNRGRSSSYSRSIRNIRNSNDNYGLSRRSSNTFNTRSSSNDTYSRSNRNSSRINSVYRSSRSRSGTTTRSSSPTTRSSGTVRSNSGSTRSSGTVRSSGGGSSRSSSRGRNN